MNIFLSIDQSKNKLKLNTKIKKGNLLLELVIAFAIFSILSISVWSILSTSLKVRNDNNKILKEIESLKIIIKELQVNTTYEEVIKKGRDNKISILEIENIKEVKKYIDKEVYENLSLQIEMIAEGQIEIIIPVSGNDELRISKYR